VFNKTIRQTFGLEVVKRVVGISIGLWEGSDWTLWGELAPSKMKEGTASSFRARDVGALATLGTFADTDQKGTLDRSSWWYTWTCLHLIRELLRMSGCKEGAAGAVGEQSL
jgi:hypothetical protein